MLTLMNFKRYNFCKYVFEFDRRQIDTANTSSDCAPETPCPQGRVSNFYKDIAWKTGKSKIPGQVQQTFSLLYKECGSCDMFARFHTKGSIK